MNILEDLLENLMETNNLRVNTKISPFQIVPSVYSYPYVIHPLSLSLLHKNNWGRGLKSVSKRAQRAKLSAITPWQKWSLQPQASVNRVDPSLSASKLPALLFLESTMWFDKCLHLRLYTFHTFSLSFLYLLQDKRYRKTR